MIRSIFLFALAVLWAGTDAQAQKITISGVVTDSLQKPLDVANIVAINQENQAMDAFGITNPEGFYSIQLKPNASYLLRVSFLGYKTREIAVITAEEDIRRDISMTPQAENLDEVEVVYEIPITIKGDTIVYNTDSFVTGTERKLADVLEKLPGIEVNDEGEIKVEGKTVSKVMVEGEDFFDGDSKIASKNIPANAVDKVEVLRNHSDVSQLSSVTNNQDNVALNIKLKEGKKRFWFGEIAAGAGPDSRYIVHPKLFYYSPEYSVNILTDLNNVGQLPFSIRDYWNFTGGFRSATRASTGTQFNTASAGLGLAQTQNNRAKSIDTKFGALNFSYKPSESWRLSGFGIYSYTNTLLETQASRTFNTSNETENTNTSADQTTQLGLFKLESSFKPNPRLQWDYEVLLRFSDEDERENTLTVSDVTDQIQENQQQTPKRVTQNNNIYYTLNEKNIFALEAQYEYSDENPFYNAIREQQPFVGIIPFDSGQSMFDINQDQYTQTNRVDAKMDYFWVNTPKSNVNLTLGTTLSHQNFNSRIFQILDSGGENSFGETDLNNQVVFDFTDVFLGLHYKWKAGKFTFNPGFHLHSYTATNRQLGTEVRDTKFNLVPDLFVNLQLRSSESLRLNYRVERNFTDINALARGFIFNNYNSLSRGNRDLESALFHNLSLNFFSFSMFNLQNIYAGITYSKRIDAYKRESDILGINQVTTTINSNLEDEILTANGSYQRTFGKIKLTGRANFSYLNTNNIVNNAPRNSQSFTQDYTFSLGSSFLNAPNLELGYRYNINDYQAGTTSSVFFTERPFARLDARFLKHFLLLADYDYYFYRDKARTIENRFGFLNASLNYRKGESKWEFSVEGTNLTNNQSLNQDSFNDLFFRTSAFEVQPIYILGKITYHL